MSRPLRAASILVVEADEVTATDLQNTLNSAGYVVQRAGSAAEALDTLKSTQADLILVSLMLPDADGLILCSTLNARFPAPIITLIARAGEVDRALALESGAIDCVTLPLERDEFLAQVKAVVQIARVRPGPIMVRRNALRVGGR
jgi:DNA-binding response OmpR family regulator